MIEKFDVMITPYQLQRTIHVYLPNDYYQSDEKYPVMYYFDGHNLFNDEDATYGKSWGIREFLDHYDKKFIIVGIECNHEGNKRLEEFSPYHYSTSYWGEVNGTGDKLMDWVVYELKPMIDAKYRTYPFRECTGIAGSSMGGLMALYTIIKHNEWFSKAACISSAIGVCNKQLKEELAKTYIRPDTRVYLSMGTREGSSRRNVAIGASINRWYANWFKEHGAYSYLNIVEGGQHNEASWEKENPIYFDFLWK